MNLSLITKLHSTEVLNKVFFWSMPAACGFTTNSCLLANPKWRKSHKLPKNPNAYGPLTDAPDFSFLDGRPVPLSQTRLLKLTKQQNLVKTAVKHLSEIEFAVNRHKNMQIEEENRKQKIIASKLKPKGEKLLKENK